LRPTAVIVPKMRPQLPPAGAVLVRRAVPSRTRSRACPFYRHAISSSRAASFLLIGRDLRVVAGLAPWAEPAVAASWRRAVQNANPRLNKILSVQTRSNLPAPAPDRPASSRPSWRRVPSAHHLHCPPSGWRLPGTSACAVAGQAPCHPAGDRCRRGAGTPWPDPALSIGSPGSADLGGLRGFVIRLLHQSDGVALLIRQLTSRAHLLQTSQRR
jgi:hypothetical protein